MDKPIYKISDFDGPLDLLLHLVQVNKMDIFDIEISIITEQYLEYINNARAENIMDLHSDFIVMASELLAIKSKMLLPLTKEEEEEGIDPRDELVERLLEYKKYKCLGDDLSDYEDNAPEYMYKPTTIPSDVKTYIPEINYDELLSGIDINKLNEVLNEVLDRKINSIDEIRSGFGKLQKEKISLKDTVMSVIKYTNEHEEYSFRKILEEQQSKMLVIVTFLAILELMKVGRIKVFQSKNFDDILIKRVEGSTALVDFETLEDA